MGNSCSCSSGVVEPELGTLGNRFINLYLAVFFTFIKLPEMSNTNDSVAT